MDTSLASPILCRVLENSFCRISLCRLSSANRAFLARISSFLAWTDDIILYYIVSNLANCVKPRCINSKSKPRRAVERVANSNQSESLLASEACRRKSTLDELAELPTTPIEPQPTLQSTTTTPLSSSWTTAITPQHHLTHPPSPPPTRPNQCPPQE